MAKIKAWLMTAIKESEQWAKMFTKKQTKETVTEYEERLQQEIVEEFQQQMKFAKAHYFEKEYNDHCPLLKRIVDLDSMDHSTPFTALSPEILFYIITQTKEVDNIEEEEVCDHCKKEYCDNVSTVEEVSKLQGKALKAQIILFNLFMTYKGNSIKEGQKKHLAEFFSNPLREPAQRTASEKC
ncbi:hypothetical protein QOT17_009954 [Balamuthia mandrillaris]